MIKLLALDMDGTLLSSDKKLAQAQIDAVQAAMATGVKLVLCTGRNMSGVRPYFDQLGLSQEADEYVIINNGCATHRTSDWALVDGQRLTSDDIRQLRALAETAAVQLVLIDEDHFWVVDEEASPLVTYDASLVFTQPQTISLDEVTNGQYKIFQAMLMGEPEVLDQFVAQHDAQLSQVMSTVRSQSYIYEAMPQGVTKATGLARLVERLGLTAAEVMAVGDADNDLEMLAYAGLAIGMRNSTPAVKAVVDELTETNDKDGVAQAIKQHLLNVIER